MANELNVTSLPFRIASGNDVDVMRMLQAENESLRQTVVEILLELDEMKSHLATQINMSA